MPRLVLASRMPAAIHAFRVLGVDESFFGLRLAYIPTADLGNWFHLRAWRPMAVKSLEKAGFQVRLLDVARAGVDEIRAVIHDADVVCVGGGNTFYLLRELRRSGAADILVDEVQGGKPYIGVSAGAVVACPDIGYIKRMDDPARGFGLLSAKGLGLVDFRIVPHLGNMVLGTAASAILGRLGNQMELRTVTDRQAIVVRGTNITKLSF